MLGSHDDAPLLSLQAGIARSVEAWNGTRRAGAMQQAPGRPQRRRVHSNGAPTNLVVHGVVPSVRVHVQVGEQRDVSEGPEEMEAPAIR